MGGMSSSGQGNPLGNSLVSIGTRFGGVAPTAPNTGASYTPVEANQYTPAFSSQQTNVQPSVSPFVAQLRSQQANPLEQFGLQTMLHSAIQSEMPQAGLPALASYRSSALDYRPNMSGITANLQRVVPSVELQQRLDAEAAARRQAEEAM
jgi:hypothetical protein